MKSEVERDERTVAVEKASNSVAYIFMSFALLFDVAYRGFKLGESSFDLLAIVVLSGMITSIYQARHQVINKGWLKAAVLAMAISIFVVVMMLTLK